MQNSRLWVLRQTQVKVFSYTTEFVFSINWTSFLSTIKNLFHCLEHIFHYLKHVFHTLKYIFQTLEQNFYHRENTFIALSYNNLSTMFQQCINYALFHSPWNALNRNYYQLYFIGFPHANLANLAKRINITPQPYIWIYFIPYSMP